MKTYIYDAKTSNGYHATAEYDGILYITAQEAYACNYRDTIRYAAEAYKVISEKGNNLFEVETDEDGDPVSYMLYWDLSDDYDPAEQEEDSACDWSSPVEVKLL